MSRPTPPISSWYTDTHRPLGLCFGRRLIAGWAAGEGQQALDDEDAEDVPAMAWARAKLELDRRALEAREAQITIDELQASNQQLRTEVAELRAAATAVAVGGRARAPREQSSPGRPRPSSEVADAAASTETVHSQSRSAGGDASADVVDRQDRTRRVLELELLLDTARDEVAALRRECIARVAGRDVADCAAALAELQGVQRQVPHAPWGVAALVWTLKGGEVARRQLLARYDDLLREHGVLERRLLVRQERIGALEALLLHGTQSRCG
jgi:hypothetical protein